MHLITLIIYQPFFNLLVAFYYGLSHIPGVTPDMGVAVILFTIVIRLLMLPITISATRSKKERYQIQQKVADIKHTFRTDPTRQKREIKKIFNSNHRILISEGVNFFIQIIIFFILYRIFTTGLKGADFHLLYGFMPPVPQHFNLVFLGVFDLTHPSWTLNLIQSVTILAVESLSLINSPFPTTRNEFIRYVIVLPVASFLIFMFLPAGKKLFVITTLWFSFFYILADMTSRAVSVIMQRSSPPAPAKLPSLQADTGSSEKPTHIK